MMTQCDECGANFDLVAGGVCMRCKRLLCSRHLHGSWMRRLMLDFGAEAVCVACRASSA
jgi:hypothetical protein